MFLVPSSTDRRRRSANTGVRILAPNGQIGVACLFDLDFMTARSPPVGTTFYTASVTARSPAWSSPSERVIVRGPAPMMRGARSEVADSQTGRRARGIFERKPRRLPPARHEKGAPSWDDPPRQEPCSSGRSLATVTRVSELSPRRSDVLLGCRRQVRIPDAESRRIVTRGATREFG